jgi:hypothetical protein
MDGTVITRVPVANVHLKKKKERKKEKKKKKIKLKNPPLFSSLSCDFHSYQTSWSWHNFLFDRKVNKDTAHMKEKVANEKNIKSRWISKGIKVSRQRLQFLCYLKKKLILPRHSLNYIKKYKKMYKKVLADARKRENDRFILKSTNCSKALWQIINKESGNALKINHKTFDVDSM